MKKAFLILAIAIIYGCTADPTTPTPPQPPRPTPTITTFTCLPAMVDPGGEVKINFRIDNIERDASTIYLTMGPLAADVILYHSPTVDQNEAKWITWGPTSASFSTRRFLVEDKTFKLELIAADKSITETREVKVR